MPTGPQVVWSPGELGNASRMAHRQERRQGHLPFSGKTNSSASSKVVYVDVISSLTNHRASKVDSIGSATSGIGLTAEFVPNGIHSVIARILTRRFP
jgi:hypothetical protein